MNAAQRFLKEVLALIGRRTDLERNAFMAAAVALIPSDVFQNRKGRAMMRLLGVNYRVDPASEVAPSVSSSPPKASRTLRMNTWNAL